MRIQLWSYNYDPEPTGIAPLSRVWALAMAERGHDVSVVAAHPHYPEPKWGARVLPYRETRDGIPVLRLPIWAGRDSLRERLRQEATYTMALTAAAPGLGKPDAIVAVSPSFPALAPAMMQSRVRGVPWVLWLQDILPDGAAESGLLDEDRAMIRMARRFESAAYRSAARVVVISDSFRENLRDKGVADDKLVRIFNPASRPVRQQPRDVRRVDDGLALNMGNIGHSQNLAAVVRVFQSSVWLAASGARFVMAGDGVAGDEVRAAIESETVRVTGILDPPQLDELLATAAVGVVTQRPRDHDFNVPSKLMNFMGAGIPVVASVDHNSEVARILRESGGGWVSDSSRVDTELVPALREAMFIPGEREYRGARALEFAQRNFEPRHMAERFEETLLDVLGRHSAPERGAPRPASRAMTGTGAR